MKCASSLQGHSRLDNLASFSSFKICMISNIHAHTQSKDTDNSGYLDRSELADMMRKLGILFKDLEQDIDAIFGEMLVLYSSGMNNLC